LIQQVSFSKALAVRPSAILIGFIRSPVPGRALEVGVAVVVIAQACMSRLKRGWVDSDRAIKLVNDGSHSLASADNDTGRVWFDEPAAGQGKLCLTVIAEKGRINDNTVQASFQVMWKLERSLEVVEDEFREDAEPVVVLKQYQLWSILDGPEPKTVLECNKHTWCRYYTNR
jgi:hypothetical protein